MIREYYDNIIEQIKKRNRIPRMIMLIIGCLIISLIYNSFEVSHNLVTGGLSGIAIVIKDVFKIEPSIFITIGTLVLIIISLVILGFKDTFYTIVGYIIFAITINITVPISKYIVINMESYFMNVVFHASIAGIGYGLIYRSGFNTGGGDTIALIFAHYLKLPITKISVVINSIIIILGAYFFGIVNTIYAIIFLKIMNFISERIMIGISDNKICLIKTRHIKELESHLRKEMEVGYTFIESTNGIGFLKKIIVMCVIPSNLYHDLKENVKKIDKKAIIISNDCYTVSGGMINNILPI